MTLPTITALPTAPSRTDPSTFAARGDAFIAALATLRSEINAWSLQLESIELAAYAPLASPTFSGTPSLPTGTTGVTQSAGDSSTKLATTAFVAATLPGGWVQLQAQTVSGTPSTIDFINGTGGAVISSTYDEYLVTFSGVKPGTDGVNLWMRTDSDAGASFDTASGDYKYTTLFTVGSTPTIGTDGGTATALVMAGPVGNASGEEGVFGHLYFWKPSAASPMRASWNVTDRNSTAGAPSITLGAGFRNTSADVDAIQFRWSSGNFSAGTIRLFGRRT